MVKAEENAQKVHLVTDFFDFYDRYFDYSGPVWKRLTSKGLTRLRALKMLDDAGFFVPQFGKIKELVESLDIEDLLQTGDKTDVIVYLNEMAHRGEYKIKMNLMAACEAFPSYLCSFYVPQITKNPISVRLLKIGNIYHFFKYTSDDRWRSNCGNVTIARMIESSIMDEFASAIAKLDHILKLPLWAIDFVRDPDGIWYAVDLNTAPKLEESLMEEVYTAKQISNLIKEYIYANLEEVE